MKTKAQYEANLIKSLCFDDDKKYLIVWKKCFYFYKAKSKQDTFLVYIPICLN